MANRLNEIDNTLFIYGDIVSDTDSLSNEEDICAKNVKDFLDRQNGRDIIIRLNSFGGNVFSGLMIYNLLRDYKGKKTIYVDGVACSIASVIALSADELILGSGSIMMIHKPLVVLMGCYNAVDLERMCKDLDSLQNAILEVYMDNLNDINYLDEIIEMVNDETYLNASQVKKYFKNVSINKKMELVACASDYAKKYFNKLESLPKDIFVDKNKVAKAQAELDMLKLKSKLN